MCERLCICSYREERLQKGVEADRAEDAAEEDSLFPEDALHDALDEELDLEDPHFIQREDFPQESDRLLARPRRRSHLHC